MKGQWAVFELYCDYRQSDTMKPSAYYVTLHVSIVQRAKYPRLVRHLSLVRVEKMTVVIDLIFM